MTVHCLGVDSYSYGKSFVTFHDLDSRTDLPQFMHPRLRERILNSEFLALLNLFVSHLNCCTSTRLEYVIFNKKFYAEIA
jgi:hypothetical protein